MRFFSARSTSFRRRWNGRVSPFPGAAPGGCCAFEPRAAARHTSWLDRRAALLLTLALAPVAAHAAGFGAAAGYSHLHPKHAALECSECHSLKPGENDIHEMPGHATCSGCHNFALEAVNRTENFCGECHTSIAATHDRPELYPFPRKHATPEFGDLFSHAAHRNAGPATRCAAPAQRVQSECADCHKTLPAQTAAAPEPSKQSEASHAFCFACHCESPVNYSAARKTENPARNDCAVCHVGHEPGLKQLSEVHDFRHADHLFDTRPRLKTAGAVSRDPDILCAECHRTAADSRHLGEIREPAASTCQSCHNGKAGLPDALPADTLTRLGASR